LATYSYLWEFVVRPGREAEFVRVYGPAGAWVELFRSAPGYLDTRLLRDLERPERFLTVDRWTDEEAYRRFRAQRAAEFDALDAQGARLMLAERELGRFTEVT
jgi:heme-degrading monooxygenase HmoA